MYSIYKYVHSGVTSTQSPGAVRIEPVTLCLVGSHSNHQAVPTPKYHVTYVFGSICQGLNATISNTAINTSREMMMDVESV